MAQRVVLHVGTMKSGTTYLQQTLYANQQLLAERGVLVPGRTWSDQVAAVRGVLGRGRDPLFGDLEQYWTRMVEEMDAWPGTAVVSVELLARVTPARVKAVVESLPRGTEVEVLLTARDLNRSLIALWQETIQNGRTWTWDHYAADAERGRHGTRSAETGLAAETFWRQQHLERLVRKWAAPVGIDHVTVVTVPPPGAAPDLLLGRFAEAVGFDPADVRGSEKANAAVGAASVEVVRRVNEVLDAHGHPWPTGQYLRKHLLAKKVLAARRAQEPRIGLQVPDWVAAYSRELVSGVQATGVRMIGSWSDLDPVPVPGIDPTTVEPTAVHQAAIDGFHGLRARYAEALPAEVVPPHAPVEDDLDAAVAGIVELLEWGMRRETADPTWRPGYVPPGAPGE